MSSYGSPDLQRHRRRRSNAFAIGGAVLLLLAVVFLLTGFRFSGTNVQPDRHTVQTPTPGTTPTGPTDEQMEEQARATARNMGWEPHQIAVGEEEVDFQNQPEERGATAFSGVTLKTRQMVSEFISGASPQSTAAREYCFAALDAEGYGQDERDRYLSGQGHVSLQFLEASDWEGNTHYVGDKIVTPDGPIVTPDGPRRAEAGDIVWIYIASDGKPILPCSVRADCGNPDFVVIRPVVPGPGNPGEPPPPSIEMICPPRAEMGPNGDCIKLPQAEDQQQNADSGAIRPVQAQPANPRVNSGPTDGAPASEPPKPEERPTAAPVSEDPTPSPTPIAPAAPNQGGSPGGDTDPSGTSSPNPQPSAQQGTNSPDNGAGAEGSGEDFHDEEPATGDGGGF